MPTAVKTQPNFVPLDPLIPATWRNVASPVDLRPLNEELRRVGGTNIFGENNFKIVWAQEYETWDLGKMRIHFDEEYIPARHEPVRYAVREDVYARAMAWLELRQEKRRSAFLKCDWAEFARFYDVSDYLKQKEISANYMKLPSNVRDYKILASLMPAGWRYLPALHTYEHTGQQVFYVLQWMSPAEFGSKKEWEKLRYSSRTTTETDEETFENLCRLENLSERARAEVWEKVKYSEKGVYVPETDREEVLVDVLGPFPENGLYERPVLRIGELRKGVVVNGKALNDFYGYKEPTLENTIEPLKELLRIRDSVSEYEKKNLTKKRFADFRAKREKAMQKFSEDFSRKFNDAKPVGKGNPTNISANKTKFDN